jgi:hypothetical protein
MKKLISILVFNLVAMALTGCVSFVAVDAYKVQKQNKAFVKTFDGGFGVSTNQYNEELAIMGAFYNCEVNNPISLCELAFINHEPATDLLKYRWKQQYIYNKRSYIYLNPEKHDGQVAYVDEEKNKAIKKDLDNKSKAIKENSGKSGVHCLSGWDGSYRPLVQIIKKNLKDPDSFKHRETRITPSENGVHIVAMTYGAKNSFGGYVVENAIARVTSQCSLIEVMDQRLNLLK